MISVLINNHNYGRYIGEAIDSVLEQTYRDFEIVVVDGDSSDNSREVIFDYVKRHPKLITALMKPTSGQGAAFNAGYRLCKGDVVAFLDSDDYWYPNKLKVIAALHGEHGAVAHFFVRSNAAHRLNYEAADLKILNDAAYYLKKYGICNTGGVITSTLSVSRPLCDKIFPIPEERFPTFADSYVMMQICYFDRIQFIPDELAYYRIHGDNAFFGNAEKGQRYLAELLKCNAELLNEKLRARSLPEIPVLDRRLYRAFLEEVGIGILPGRDYVLYGAGQLGAEMKRILEAFGARVRYYCDSQKEKWGQIYNGAPVLSPRELVQRRSEYYKICVSSMFSPEIAALLESLGFRRDEDFLCRECTMGYPLPDA
jgi:glycosyltransferase involved in cell wall biosynthesis